MLLDDVLGLLLQESDLSKLTREQYERSVTRFGAFLERPAKIADLTLDNANGFLRWARTEYDLSPVSVKNHRAGIIRIWNYCVDPLGKCDDFNPRRIKTPKIPEKIVKAWSREQVDLLIASARDMPGQLQCGVPASLFLTCWIWVGFDTGFRPGDLLSLTWDEVDTREKTITTVQNKNGKIHTAPLGGSALAALATMRSYGFSHVFPVGASGVHRWERILFRRAKKRGFHRLHRQGLGTLRKTHATLVYLDHDEAAAAASLGHSDARTVRKHYIDSKELRRGYLPGSQRQTDRGRNSKRA